MGRRSGNDGLTIVQVPYWTLAYPNEDAPRDTSDLEEIMREHDRLRALGRDPVAEAKAEAKRRKREKRAAKRKRSTSSI